MLQGSYGKEPFDLRLTTLCMARSFAKILAITLIGTLLFGGGYYVKNVLLRGEILYSVTSTFKVDYADEDWAQYGTYINATTWNTHVQAKEFLDMAKAHLPASEPGLQESGVTLKADVPSDLRVLTVTVTSNLPEKSVQAAKAVEAAMTEDFPGVTEEVSAIRVTDPAVTATEVFSDARPLRAFILSAVLSFFFAVVVFLLKETGDDSIWLPASIWKRYGLPVLGTVETPELSENAAYLFRGMKKAAVCAVCREVDPAEAAEKITQAVEGKSKTADAAKAESGFPQWIPVPTPGLAPEVCRELRRMDGILLVVRAGEHAGKPLEYTLQYLEQQDCKVTAVVLWDADETLIKRYYCFCKK